MLKRRETNEETIVRYKSGDESALEDLLKANRGILCKMARKFGSLALSVSCLVEHLRRRGA